MKIIFAQTSNEVKTDIHPKYFPKASVKCACGNTFFVGSTKEFIETEICAQCHPFYTKKEKVLDTLGRVQKFKDRASKKSDKPKKTKSKARNPFDPQGIPAGASQTNLNDQITKIKNT